MSTMTLKSAKGEGDFFRLHFWGAVLLVLGALLALGAFPAHAVPLAGTSIGNQASASYTDNNSIARITVSNSVSTIVAAVGVATMTSSQTKVGAPGQTVSFPHTIVNNGNSSDTFTVTLGAKVDNVGGPTGAFATAGAGVYADLNCDGQADNNVVTNTLGPVAPGGQVCFVVQATLGTTAGNDSQVPINFNSSIAGATLTGNPNVDRVSISANAVINVSKSISTTVGPTGTIVTYQLTYRNTGTVSAGSVVIADVLPVGANYVAGSGRWSVLTGSALTDSPNDNDAGGVTPNRIDYTAVPSSATSGGTVLAVIERVDPGVQGILEFRATMTSASATSFDNTAQWCYSDVGVNGSIIAGTVGTNCANIRNNSQFGASPATSPATADINAIANFGSTGNANTTNTVRFTIPAVGAVANFRITDNVGNVDGTNPASVAASTLIVNASGVNDDVIHATAGQGTIATWDAYVFNAGGTDTFNITVATASATTSNFPAGTTFLLLRSDGATPLTDSNSDGILDTGPVTSGAQVSVRVVAILPPSAPAGNYDAIVQAQSTNTTTAVNTVAVRAAIVGSRVDLTNYNGGGAGQTVSGFGEAAPQTTVTANPGTAATFGLIVTNTGSVPDSFDLTYNLALGSYNLTAPYAFTSPSQFSGGYSLAFFRDTGTTCAVAERGAQISNTGVISPSGTVRVCAVVTIPAGASAGNTEIYFRALSPTTFSGNALTSSGDVKRDRLTVNVFRAVSISPNNSGQIFPGGSIQYCHTVTNGGNVSETITLTQADQSLFTAGAAGWAQFATVYVDTDNNCVLNGTENTSPQTLTPTGLQGTYAAGEKRNFIVVVQAPSGASAGQTNTSKFDLVTAANPTVLAATASDVTTVVVGQVQLVKEQVLDPSATCATNMNLAGVGALTFAQTPIPITAGATPGRCIVYRVTATNVGTQSVTSLTINDVAPPNTQLSTTGTPSIPFCTTTAPIGACSATVTGQNVTATLNPLASPLTGGSTLVLYFRVRIDP